MPNYEPLQQVFLIAMPSLKDPVFRQSVVYLWEYSAAGAKGVIINKPIKPHLGNLLRELQIPIHNDQAETHPMLLGGPVSSDRGFLVQRQHNVDCETGETGLRIMVTACSSKEDLIPLAEGQGLNDTLVALGCANWEPGQLDQELKNNDWLVAPFNETTLFSILSEQMASEASAIYAWRDAAATMGINLSNLSLEAGHA